MISVYSSPQPANKTYDLGLSDVFSHLMTCQAECQHVRELQDKFGVFTVALAIDRINQRHD